MGPDAKPASTNSFVGRERELAELRHALDEADGGHGRLFLLSGEPGIGKTRLAEEIASDAASRGMRVAWGRCWEGGGAPAYWPWIRILRTLLIEPNRLRGRGPIVPPEVAQLLPELASETQRPRPSDPQEARFQLFDAVATLIKDLARTQPLLLIVEDLHDADEASLSMLRFAARESRDARIAILSSFREVEVERSSTISSIVSDLTREGHQILLRGLSESEVAGFMAARAGVAIGLGLVASILEATGGNPLFLNGVVSMLMAEGKLSDPAKLRTSDLKLPAGVRVAIRKQINGLSERAQATLVVASALGNEFDQATVKRIPGLTSESILDGLGESVRAGVLLCIAENPARYRFAHALIRATLYNELAAAERARLHFTIANTLEQLYAGDLASHVTDLAHHYVNALPGGSAEKAIDYSIRAGDAALSVFAHREAISQWEMTAALIKTYGTDPEREADLLTKLGVTLQQFSSERGISHLEAALALYQSLNNEERAAELHQRLGLFLSSPGASKDVARALDHLSKARSFLEKQPDSAGLATVYYGLSQLAQCELRFRESVTCMQRAVEAAQRAGANDEWCACAAQLGVCLIQAGRLREAHALGVQVGERIASVRVQLSAFGAYWSLGGLSSELCDYEQARSWWQRGLLEKKMALYQRHTFTALIAYAVAWTGDLALARQRFGETAIPPDGMLLFMEGDWEGARTWFDNSYKLLINLPADALSVSRGFGRVLRVMGEAGLGCTLLEQLLARFPADEPHLQIEMGARPELALLYLELGRTDAALEQVARCDEILAAGEDWRVMAGHHARASAASLAAAGNYHAAELLFAKASAIFNRHSSVWDEAENLHYWGRALLAAGDQFRAVEKFQAAIDIYRRYGAGQRWIDRVTTDMPPAATSESASTANLPAQLSTFRREGEYWTLSYQSQVFRLRDTHGLHYIAHLLQHAGQQVSAIELAALIAGGYAANGGDSSDAIASGHLTSDLGDAGEMIDPRSIAQYKRRREELREELDLALRANDVGAQQRSRAELDAIAHELNSGTGQGGQLRKVAAHRERARVAVTKRIKSALANIRAVDPSMGRHLANSIQTGHSCCYAPREPISWQL